MAESTRIVRDRQGYQYGAVDTAIGEPPDGNAAILGTTTTITAYPTSAGAYYAMNPTEVNSNEVEGGAATYVVDTSTTFYAWNTGTTIPAVGTRVICHGVGGRWVFRWDR